MRTILMAILIILGGCLMIGCVDQLDEKMNVVRDKAQTADAAFIAASKAFIGGAGDMADKKHQIQQQLIDDTWRNWLALHTDAAGRVTIDAATLTAALAKRDEARATLAASTEGWQAYVLAYRDAITEYQTLHAAIWSEEQDVIAAKRSAQALLDKSLTALGAIAAGAGIGLAF